MDLNPPKLTISSAQDFRRSREGAWIEIYSVGGSDSADKRRSREGAWIEILLPATH